MPDQSVHIRWHSSSSDQNGQYRINSYADDFGNSVSQIDVQDTFYVDTKVETSKHSYLYTVKEIDACGNVGPVGTFGKSILLKANFEDEMSFLNWTAYEHWDFSQLEHHIEFVRQEVIVPVAQVSSSRYSYTDPTLYLDVDGYYPFRVYTSNTNLDTSYSNIALASGKAIFIIPNSFSPNNDGINDRFDFFTLFVVKNHQISASDYELNVYNRWGENVYSTNNREKLWDGTFQGERLPGGVYLYRITFTEGSGKRFYESGTVHLIR